MRTTLQNCRSCKSVAYAFSVFQLNGIESLNIAVFTDSAWQREMLQKTRWCRGRDAINRLRHPGYTPHMNHVFMARAIQLSITNVLTGSGGPFGAVIVKDGQIIAEGVNCVTGKNDPTAHAEIVAMREACAKLGSFELSGCEIYTSCEPCPMCFGAIYWARPDRVYFAGTAADAANAGFDDSFIYQEIGKQHAQRKIPMIDMMHEQALEAFRVWEKQANKIPY
jgi:guanine deaminase